MAGSSQFGIAFSNTAAFLWVNSLTKQREMTHFPPPLPNLNMLGVKLDKCIWNAEKLLFKHNSRLKNEGGGRVGIIFWIVVLCVCVCVSAFGTAWGRIKGDILFQMSESTLTIRDVSAVTIHKI